LNALIESEFLELKFLKYLYKNLVGVKKGFLFLLTQ